MKRMIDVNANYEIEYRYSEKDRDYKDFNRLNVVVLLSKDKTGNRVVLRADNSDKQTGLWPMHIHIPDSKDRSYFVYWGSTLESNWDRFKGSFSDEAVKLVGEEHREDLGKALEELRFEFDQKI